MSFITKFLTTKVLGYSTLALLLALVASLTFGWVQTSRLATANVAITSGASANKLLIERVNSDRSLIAGRDLLIADQNAGIQALHDTDVQNRKDYLIRIAAADKVAGTYQAKAQNILNRSVATTDELQRSRAALALIVETLAAERNPNVHP